MTLSEMTKANGFEYEAEFHKLVSAVDISTQEKFLAFKKWQREDGTKEGLLKLQGMGLYGLRIWWVDEEDCKAIGSELPGFPPAYLMTEYRSVLGRAGRGRLWTDPMFGNVAVDPWPDTPMAKRLSLCAGIVIREEHVVHIELLPGVITDLKLNRLRERVAI